MPTIASVRAAVLLPALVALAFLFAGASVAAGAGCLLPPVQAPVVDAFRSPGCLWCAGNRGLEFAVASGTAVRAAAGGTVTFSGSVAGTVYVVVDHGDGLRATYGRLASAAVAGGDRVATGGVIGRSGGAGLYFGLRRGEVYIDPAPLLGRLVERWRLVPVDGSAARRPPPPEVRCPGGR